MEIVNQQLAAELAAGTPVRLNLGPGPTRLDGFYGIDHVRMPSTDVIADLNEGLKGFPDGSVAEIYARHTLEHVREFLPLMAEMHRVLRPGGRLRVIVPHFSNPLAYSDPTHVRFFGLYTFYYFCEPDHQPRRKVPHFYSKVRYTVERVRIGFDRETLWFRLLSPALEAMVNAGAWTQAVYERRMVWVMPAAEIHAVLVPVKNL